MRRRFVVACGLLVTSVLCGDEGQKEFHFWKEMLHMLFNLGILLALLFVTIGFLKRYMKSRLRNFNSGGKIQVIEKRMLNPKASLYLVHIAGKNVVIAESPAGVQLITELSAETILEEVVPQEAKVKLSFKEILQNKLRKLVKISR